MSTENTNANLGGADEIYDKSNESNPPSSSSSSTEILKSDEINEKTIFEPPDSVPTLIESSSSSSSSSGVSDLSTNPNETPIIVQSTYDPITKMTKSIILLLVSLTLLLDGMLNMVILPIIPEYLKYLPNTTSDVTSTKPASFLNSTTTTAKSPITFEYSRNDLAVGFLFATKPLIQLIVNPFSGTLIDHIGYKIPLGIGLCIQLASTLTFALTDSFQFLFLARALQG